MAKISHPLTRRAFFRGLVPSWLTKRVVVIALAVGAGGYAAINLIEMVQKRGVVASARTAGFLAGICVLFYLLNQLSVVVRRAIAASSADFRAFVDNFSLLVALAAAMWCGAMLHARWSAGEDISATLVVFGVFIWLILVRRARPE